MKALIFDSGTLITLSMNGLLNILEELKENFNGKFIITHAVKKEIIDRPITVPRFELGALRVKQLLDLGILELPESLGLSHETIQRETNNLLNIANHYIEVHGKWIQIVSEGEISCLAVSSELTKKGIENLIAIDERTTRLLSERPESLEKLMSDRLHQRLSLSSKNFSAFKQFRFIRSSEIVYVAYKKGLLHLEGKKALEAALYATKYGGAAISFEEIDVLKKL